LARSRSLPTNLYDDPAFFDLSSETQAVLVGLVLCADDYGRGLAHTGWLARKFNKSLSVVEEALQHLEAVHLLHCYQIAQQRYYVLPQWDEWETLSRPTPSKYPAPPQQVTHTSFQDSPGCAQNPQENAGNVGNVLNEGEGEDEEEGEREEEGEGEEEGHPSNVVTFPTLDADAASLSQHALPDVTNQVARILKLSPTEALSRLIGEYIGESSISLYGEADAAREWIDDPRRNRKRQRMTPAFFRRWLKRERVAQQQQHKPIAAQATGTDVNAAATLSEQQGQERPVTAKSRADPYQAFLEQRVQELSDATIHREGRSL
jgi:hypothetical protein